MIAEDLDNVSKDQLEDADQEIAKAWGKDIEEKLDSLLDFRITSSDGGTNSNEPQRVIIYYKVKRDFEALVEEFEDACASRKKTIQPYAQVTEGAMELSDEEFEEEFAFLEDNFDEDARNVLNALADQRAEVVEHLRLANAVVAKLAPPQLRAIAQRSDVLRIEAEKPMAVELDRSAVDINAVEARRQHLIESGRGIIVAVLDGEVDLNHPDLKGRVVQKRNYTDEPWGNPSKHGTHVAGIIAGNGEKYKGMAPEAIIWNYKIYPSQETSSSQGSRSADAIEDAAKDNAHVINCSWGVSGTELDGKSVWATTAERATKLGAVLVKSAGNKGPDERTLTSPADAFGDVIVVGAANRESGGVTDFSSRGPTADNRPKPDLCAPGEKIMSAKEGGGYRSLSGTSMAVPHISGIAALMLQRNPKLKPWQIKKALVDSCRQFDTNDFGRDSQGAGFVDVVKAVNAAAQAPSSETALTGILIKENRLQERITVLLKNTGKADMLHTTATLEPPSAKIKVVEGSGQLGTIRQGADKRAAFLIEIAPDIAPGDYGFRLLATFQGPSGEAQSAECLVSYQVAKVTS